MKLRRGWSISRMRLRSLLERSQVERELERELRFHIDQQTEENVTRGIPPDQARRLALRRLGGLAQIEEECREMRRTNYVENFWHDLRYAVRTLAANRGFTMVMVLTLALSIGANSAIFTVIDNVLLKPLPYPEPDRVVRIFFSNSTYPKFRFNPFDFRDYRARNRSFDSMGGFLRHDLQLSSGGQPERLTAIRVTAGYFRVLGFCPTRGREFESKDELPGPDRQVILSDRLWRRRFEADPNIVGRKITLDSQPFVVAGVMPPRIFHPGNDRNAIAHGDTVDLWWAFTFVGDPNNRGSHYVDGIGRLKRGVSPRQAQAEMQSIATELEREHPDFHENWQVHVVPLHHDVVGGSRRLLLVLFGAVGFVLLIACVNAANLLLARATARQREIAVRSALGAGRYRLIRQMLTESVLIAVVGAALGALVAVGGVRILVSLLPANFPRADVIQVNGTVFAFTLLVAIATGLFFGIAPALQASRTELNQALHSGSRTSTSSARQLRLRDSLVVAEVALASVLLIGAGLMLRSFLNLLRMDPGFRPEHALTASISLPDQEYRKNETVVHFCAELVRNLASLSGVQFAGAGTDLPWTGYNENIGGFLIEGRTRAPNERIHARYHAATPDYFRALDIPLLRGRLFTEQDHKTAPQVLIINQSMARRYWPNGDAIGKRVSFFTDKPKPEDWMTVVGIIGDVKDTPLSKATEPAFWWALHQHQPSRTISIVVRSGSDPASLLNGVRQEVQRLNPALAVADVRLMDQIADASVSTPRFTLFLVGLFAGLALLLAASGTYGVVSYSVKRRTHEFGLRMALGARRWDVLRLVLVHGVKLSLAGAALGVLCALALARIFQSLLYEVRAEDPLTFAAVSLLSLAVAAIACYIPARRATQAEPMSVLGSE